MYRSDLSMLTPPGDSPGFRIQYQDAIRLVITEGRVRTITSHNVIVPSQPSMRKSIIVTQSYIQNSLVCILKRSLGTLQHQRILFSSSSWLLSAQWYDVHPSPSPSRSDLTRPTLRKLCQCCPTSILNLV